MPPLPSVCLHPCTEIQQPQGARVMSVGSIRGGSSFNDSDRVTIEGTVRALQRSEQGKMVELLHQAFGVCQALCRSYELP